MQCEKSKKYFNEREEYIVLKSNKLISMFLAIVIMLSLGCMGVFADDISTAEEYTGISIIQVSENASQEEINVVLNEAMEESNFDKEINETSEARAAFLIKPFIIRSGNTTDCQLYLSWDVTGGYVLDGIAFDSVILNNGSLLFPITYANIGGSYLKCPTSSYGSVLVRNITLPLDITVYGKSTAMKGSIVGQGWISCLDISGKVPMN